MNKVLNRISYSSEGDLFIMAVTVKILKNRPNSNFIDKAGIEIGIYDLDKDNLYCTACNKRWVPVGLRRRKTWYVAWKAHAISSTYLLAPRVRWLRVEGFIVPPLPSRHKTPGHQVPPAQLHLEHQRLLVLEEGKAARRAMAQFLLQPLPCGDCDGKRAGGWRGGEGSFYWGARVLGCCQPKSCHL